LHYEKGTACRNLVKGFSALTFLLRFCVKTKMKARLARQTIFAAHARPPFQKKCESCPATDGGYYLDSLGAPSSHAGTEVEFIV